MSDHIAIKVDSVSKTFKLPHEKNTSVKNTIVNFSKRKKTYEKQQVLKNVSFEVKQGEFFGIVGRNGSGKSTLLKLIAGIYAPSGGGISVQGKLTPFIELGVGFNPELTGKENVFLNGALLGFNRSEMRKMYDKIVEFAELEKFMDQQLKNYSSGMQVRLAFSIAIRVKSDILVLDEVLAVGDEAFQRKCVKVFDSYRNNKQTVVLVTHDMETVKKYCTRAILVNDGEIIESGSPIEVASKYSMLNQTATEKTEKQVQLQTSKHIKISFPNKPGQGHPHYSYDEKMLVRLEWPKSKDVDMAGVAIYSSIGESIFATNTGIDGQKVTTNSITYSVDLSIGGGEYYVSAGIFYGEDQNIVDFVTRGPTFTVDDDSEKNGLGVVRLDHKWTSE